MGKFLQLSCLQKRQLGHTNFGTGGLANSIGAFFETDFGTCIVLHHSTCLIGGTNSFPAMLRMTSSSQRLVSAASGGRIAAGAGDCRLHAGVRCQLGPCIRGASRPARVLLRVSLPQRSVVSRSRPGHNPAHSPSHPVSASDLALSVVRPLRGVHLLLGRSHETSL